MSFLLKNISFLKDEPFSDDDPFDDIDDDSETTEVINPDDPMFLSMDSTEIHDAVQEVNQKITNISSKKTNKIQNPIKVLVKKPKNLKEKNVILFLRFQSKKEDLEWMALIWI